jgi:hypothetical protein
MIDTSDSMGEDGRGDMGLFKRKPLMSLLVFRSAPSPRSEGESLRRPENRSGISCIATVKR